MNNDNSIVMAYLKFDKLLKYVQFLYNGQIGFHTLNVVQSYTNSDIDVFGIGKLYESKPGAFEWYVNMVNPKEDPYQYNYNKMVKNPDGSYSIGNFSKLSVYSKDGVGYNEGSMQTYNFTKLDFKGYWYKPNDWKNIAMTGEFHYRGGNGQGITHYVRSEDHSLLHSGCGASSYKNKIYFDETNNFNKEQTHPFSWKTSNLQHNYRHLKDHWFGFKTVVYNLPTCHVKLQNWLGAFNDDN